MTRPTQTLDDMMADYDAERLRDIAREEARDAEPSRAAAIAARRAAERDKEIRQGLRTPDGEWIIRPEDDDNEESDDETHDGE